jgi:hypothetical protein
MVAIPDRLAAPVLPDDPTQADLGAQVYYLVCMACHGDAGQGLTPEWLEEWGLGNDSCWQSKCHASNHPPEGFKLPKMIPPVVGAIMPARFADAAALHAYLVERMPWQAPGSLAAEEYWQLTAVLLRMNGRDPGQMTLGPTNAANFRLRPEAAEPLGQRAVRVSSGAALVVGLLVLVGVILIVKSAGRGRRDEI